MIPLHRPDFGLATVLLSSSRGGEQRSLKRLEEAYAEAAGCPDAVWLPSARTGICWALKAAIRPATRVVTPAFTCTVVHEAVVRSGGAMQLLDNGPKGVLMDLPALEGSQSGDYAEVLCEVYGHAYDLAQLANRAASPPVLRLVDMAMSVPHPSLFARLAQKDFAVISFGNGKCMFTGWGGIGLSRDAALVEEVRRLRDACLVQGGAGLLLKRVAKVSLRTVGQIPPIFSLAWWLWYRGRPLVAKARGLLRRRRASNAAAAKPLAYPADWSDDQKLDSEWRLPSTRLDRGLGLWNLEHAERSVAARLELARRYAQNLAGTGGIVLPEPSPHALSHYSIRVDATVRNELKERLRHSGVYTISLWGFPEYLDKEKFPNRYRLSSEVMNLPLSPWMAGHHVDQVCDRLLQCLRQLKP